MDPGTPGANRSKDPKPDFPKACPQFDQSRSSLQFSIIWAGGSLVPWLGAGGRAVTQEGTTLHLAGRTRHCVQVPPREGRFLRAQQ